MPRPVFAFGVKWQAKMLADCQCWDWLISYTELKSGETLLNYIQKIRESAPSDSIFMLDSGAFSVFSRGEHIDIWNYIEFIKENYTLFTHVFVLDVIESPWLSEVNHQLMRRELGDIPIILLPVFHSGEPVNLLRYLLKQADWIGLAPKNGWTATKSNQRWIADIFAQVDFANVKTHGLGCGGTSYWTSPFTTMDATTWTVARGYILTPYGPIYVSERSPLTKKVTKRLLNAGEVMAFISDVCDAGGFSVKELATDYMARNRFNILATKRLAAMRSTPTQKMRSLFTDEDCAFGYCEPFDEQWLKGLIEHKLALGQEYRGYDV